MLHASDFDCALHGPAILAQAGQRAYVAIIQRMLSRVDVVAPFLSADISTTPTLATP